MDYKAPRRSLNAACLCLLVCHLYQMRKRRFGAPHRPSKHRVQSPQLSPHPLRSQSIIRRACDDTSSACSPFAYISKVPSATVDSSLCSSVLIYAKHLQEIGRAGRDGSPAHCHLFLDDADYIKLRSLAHRYVYNLVGTFLSMFVQKLFIVVLSDALALCPSPAVCEISSFFSILFPFALSLFSVF